MGIELENNDGYTDLYPPSNLQRIVRFNERSGKSCELRGIKHPAIKEQLSFLKEELKELSDALKADDRKETVDALADIIVVVAGTLHRLGYDPDHVMDIVNDSNDSKVVDPNDYHAVRASIDKYADDPRYTDIVVDSAGAVSGTVVETGERKTLKGVGYEAPDWTRLDPELV